MNQTTYTITLNNDLIHTLHHALSRHFRAEVRRDPGSKVEVKRIRELFSLLQEAGFNQDNPYLWLSDQDEEPSAP